MNRKEPNETFMMVSNRKTPFGFHGLYNNISALPFRPSRCIKASFYSPENSLNCPTTKGFRTKISMELVY